MKFLVFVFVLTNCKPVSSQDFYEFLVRNVMHSEIDIKPKIDCSGKISTEKKREIIDQFCLQMDYSWAGKNNRHRDDEFTVADINNDGQLDIFYSGFLNGAADTWTYVYLNKNGKFTEIFEGMGTIENCLLNPNKEKQLLFYSGGYTDECSWNYFIISIQAQLDKISIDTLVKIPSNLKEPDSFMASCEFMVKKDKYNLRSQPIINNERNEPCNENGNTVNTYTTGDKGKAFAQKKDDTGRIWWFVVMEDKYCGWMSSRYLAK